VRQLGDTTGDVARTRPDASIAWTATYGVLEDVMIVVSKPLRGCDPRTRRASGPVPPRTCQVATSVAPFQLTETAMPAPEAPATTTGGSRGTPCHSKR